jgi:hypothetical protein
MNQSHNKPQMSKSPSKNYISPFLIKKSRQYQSVERFDKSGNQSQTGLDYNRVTSSLGRSSSTNHFLISKIRNMEDTGNKHLKMKSSFENVTNNMSRSKSILSFTAPSSSLANRSKKYYDMGQSGNQFLIKKSSQIKLNSKDSNIFSQTSNSFNFKRPNVYQGLSSFNGNGESQSSSKDTTS